MKKLLTSVLLLITITLQAQITISGHVFDVNQSPLEGASVYLNNTSIGVTTDTNGAFKLDIKKGNHTLVVSYIGYETEQYVLNTSQLKQPLKFNLKTKNNVLDEVVIKKRKRISNAKRKALLRKFRKSFLGESKFVSTCKILNEDVIEFDIDPKEKVTEVSASEPLKIVHPSFGYIIYYDLKYFKLTPLSVSYFGYTKYDKISGLEDREEEWKHNRWEAYHGSKMHFIRGVTRETSEYEGFTVDLIDRIPNPERPSYDEIIAAEKFLKRHGGLQRNPYNSSNSRDLKIREAEQTLERAKLPKYIDDVVEADVSGIKYTVVDKQNKIHIKTDHYLRVTYDKEEPDDKYDTTNNSEEYQVSVILLYTKSAEILRSGIFKKPNHVFVEGYWAFEKVGDLLPLNYNPKEYGDQ